MSPEKNSGSVYPVLDRIESRLHVARRQRVRSAIVRACLEALSLQLLLLPLAGLWAAVHPYDPLGLQLALSTWLVFIWPLLQLAILRRQGLFGSRGIHRVAADFDRLNPAAPDIFRTVLSRHSHSPETLAALDAFYASWESRLREPAAPVFTRARAAALSAAAVFALALPFVAGQILGSSLPGGAGDVFQRMVLPLRAWNAIPAPRLTPLDLPETVMRGDSLTVTVITEHVSATRPVYVHLVLPTGETRFEMRRGLDGVLTGGLRSGSDSSRYTVGPATQDFSLRFSTAGFMSRLYTVRVVEPPRLASLGVVVAPPAYSGLASERFAEMPALLSLLPGSIVTWSARAAEPLKGLAADYVSESSTAKPQRVPLKVSVPKGEEGDGLAFSFRHRVLRAGELRLRLSDERGGKSTEGPFRVELKIDASPEIALLAPASDQDLGRTLKLPVLFRARDDYGISRVLLRYSVLRDGQSGSAPSASSKDGSVEVTRWLGSRDGMGGGVWDAGSLGLDAGDGVEIWLEAIDNDAVSGPKSAFSARVKLRLPSRDEVRSAVQAGERDAAVSLTSALEREKRLRREEERPNKGAATEGANSPLAAPVPEWEVRRVLSDQPRQHLKDLQRQLDAEIKAAEKQVQERAQEAKATTNKEAAKESAKKVLEATRASKALQEIRKEVQAQEKRLPPPEIGSAPLEQQKKSLDALTADQKALEKKLEETPPPAQSKKSDPSLAENRKQLEESLKRNLQEQKDMKAWLGEQDRNKTTEQKRSDQSSRNAAQIEQDMKKALEQIDKAMEKGLENGTLSPDVLEKMERIRELLEEVLDPDEKESLRQASQNEDVEAGDLQKAMKNLLDKKEGLRQNLEKAIKMLEALRETRALRDAAGEMREMAEEQKEVANDIANSDKASVDKAEKASAAELADRQEELNRQMDAAMKSLDNLSKSPSMKEALKDFDKQKPREARTNMQKAGDKLKAPSPDKKAAKQSADLAAKQLKQMAAELDKKVAQMDKAANAAEIRTMLEETLDFSAWLEAARDPNGDEARRWGGEEAVRQGAIRIAKWLRARLEKLADADPFEGDMLRRESAALGIVADAMVADATFSQAGLESLRNHALKAARELFKMLDKNQDSGGSEDGEGAGDSDNSGGEDGDSGQEGISGRMKGASGKQAAVNRATSELLKSFLEGRQGRPQGEPGGQASGQGSGQGQSVGGQPGGQSGGGQSGGQGNGSTPGSQGGSQSGNQGGNQSGGENSGSGDGKSNGLANAQQQIGESLEQMAEAAGDAGGAARKLRQLAEEARELEEALRRRSLSPGEIQRRQERFQTRLLEAANALEERGNEKERRAEAYKGGALPPPEVVGATPDENRIKELKRRRDEARKLPLSSEEKRRMEWYFEQLLAP